MKVDVIIPVYKGLAKTQQCIESIFAYSQKTDFDLIMINDASPDKNLTDYLETFNNHPNVYLISNPANKGFTGTANHGMSLHTSRDVVLLNSDTVVANDWLDRLVKCAYSEPAIGTVTPFSNNATLCSYPHFCENNLLVTDLELLDQACKEANKGRVLDIPTGVGFCLYIRRDCLNEVGYFDEENFPIGYGEENDFCMRASQAGWRNVLCADVFVYHAGGVSFGESQVPLQAQGMKKLLELHPHYLAKITDFIAQDPIRPLRKAVDQWRTRYSTEQALQVLEERYTEAQSYWQKQHELQTILQTLNKAIIERDQARQHVEDLLELARTDYRKIESALAEAQSYVVSKENENKRLTAALKEAQHYVELRQQDINQLNENIMLLTDQLNQNYCQLQQLTVQLQQANERIALLEKELAVIYSSRSWRYTKIFRRSG